MLVAEKKNTTTVDCQIVLYNGGTFVPQPYSVEKPKFSNAKVKQTINRLAKTSGGIVGFSRNTGAYYRWCLTRHNRAAYAEATLDNVVMLNNYTDAHKSTLPAERNRSKKELNEVTFRQPICCGRNTIK